MAERRMFSKTVVDADRFLQLPVKAQLLYFHLGMRADDDGFVGNCRGLMRMLGFRKPELTVLLEAGYLLEFSDGTAVITHWKVHNQLRKDRYKPTVYQQWLAQLKVDAGGVYHLAKNWQPDDNQMVDTLATQDRIGKDRLGKGRIDEDREAAAPEAAAALSSSSSSIDILELYQNCCPGLLPCIHMDTDTKKRLEQLPNKGWNRDQLEQAFRKAQQLPYLRGENDTGWRAGLSWLSREENLRKVLEGQYAPWEKKKPAATQYGSGKLGAAEMEAIQRLLAEADAG